MNQLSAGYVKLVKYFVCRGSMYLYSFLKQINQLWTGQKRTYLKTQESNQLRSVGYISLSLNTISKSVIFGRVRKIILKDIKLWAGYKSLYQKLIRGSWGLATFSIIFLLKVTFRMRHVIPEMMISSRVCVQKLLI